MKPLQIALLVIAGAACGAVVMRMARGPAGSLLGVARPATAARQTPAPDTTKPPVSAVETTPEAPAALPPPATQPASQPGAASTTTSAARPSPFPERHSGKTAPPARQSHSEAMTMARSAPPPVAARTPVVVPQSAPPEADRPAPPAAAAQPEPPPPDLPSARVEPENSTPAPTSAPQSAPRAAPPPEPNRATLNAGLLIPVRLANGLSSERNQPGDTFHATLERELVADGFVIAERGARVEGRVVAVDHGKAGGAASLAVALTWIFTSDGQAVPVETDPFHRHAEPSHAQAEKIGGGIGAGAGGPAVLAPQTSITFRLKTAKTITEQK